MSTIRTTGTAANEAGGVGESSEASVGPLAGPLPRTGRRDLAEPADTATEEPSAVQTARRQRRKSVAWPPLSGRVHRDSQRHGLERGGVLPDGTAGGEYKHRRGRAGGTEDGRDARGGHRIRRGRARPRRCGHRHGHGGRPMANRRPGRHRLSPAVHASPHRSRRADGGRHHLGRPELLRGASQRHHALRAPASRSLRASGSLGRPIRGGDGRRGSEHVPFACPEKVPGDRPSNAARRTR